MPVILPNPVICVKSFLPHAVTALRDYCLMGKPSRQVVAENLRAIAKSRFGEKFQGKLIEAGIANGTVTRALSGETSIGLDALDAIASALGVSSAALLCYGYNIEDPPVCLPKSVADQARAGRLMEEAIKKLRESSQQ